MLPVPMRFGLDFGTSNTPLAVWDGDRKGVWGLVALRRYARRR